MHCISCKTHIINQTLNLFLTSDGNCVLVCPNNTYKFEPNKTCLNICPSDFEINYEQNKCIKKIEQITSSEFKTQIMKNISAFIDTTNSSNVINGSDFIAVIIPSDKMDPKEQLKKGISAIDLGNCTNVIKEYYNISQNESLYVLNIESKKNETAKKETKNDNTFNLGKDIQLEIYDKSGRKLDLSLCKQDIKVMKYIGDVTELDIQSAKSLASQGIDVFNADDKFFNDICQNFNNTYGKDIVISDRRANIYQNAQFCQNGCFYTGMNYELMTANCICDSSLLQSSSVNNTNIGDKINKEESDTFKALTKSFIANLLDFNSEVFKCYNLVFNSQILHDNIGFYCMLFLFVLQIIFLIAFLIKRLNPIKISLLIFHNNRQKESNSFPPLKNREKKRKNKNIYFNNDKNNKYCHNFIKEEDYSLNFNKNKLKFKVLNFDHIKDKEESNDINSIRNLIKNKREGKLIFTKKLASIINIQSPIININRITKKRKKKKKKESFIETLNESKLYTTKSIKKISNQNLKNKKIIVYIRWRRLKKKIEI